MSSSATGIPEGLDVDQMVLNYLKKKGMGSAVLQLQSKLKEQDTSETTTKQQLEQDDAQYRNQRSLLVKSTGGSYGYDRDSVRYTMHYYIGLFLFVGLIVVHARCFKMLTLFFIPTTLLLIIKLFQAWPIMQWGLPDMEDTDGMGSAEAKAYIDAFVTLQLWVLSLPDSGSSATNDKLQTVQKLIRDKKDAISLKSVISELAQPTASNSSSGYDPVIASIKPELLAVTFSLLVHTYCECLEAGMEGSAQTLRDAFECIYEPLYEEQYRDLYHCNTTEDMMTLNRHNSQHMECLTNLKKISVSIAQHQLKREQLKAQTTVDGNALSAQQQAMKEQQLARFNHHIAALNGKHEDLSAKATAAFDKMHYLPFLRRARAVRWQLSLSAQSYGTLCTFLNGRDESLLCMSTLLQAKCELHIEKRTPLPYTPACVLDETGGRLEATLTKNAMQIDWGAPMAGRRDKDVPYPKFDLDEEYDDESAAKRDKLKVQFNRALLTNGFRRLEALERKREFDALSPEGQKRRKSGLIPKLRIADPLEPSILLTTLSANTGPALKPKTTAQDVRTIWDEPGVGLCCAKLCQPDGRRIAVGCDDSAVRVYSADSKEPQNILIGHKNGFPVFGVDWNRDGRALLSCGGDGSVRLWDTLVTGPYGDLVKEAPPKPAVAGPDEMVPNIRDNKQKYTNGAALAVYRGHAPMATVWDVAFAPSGYYFASCGSDATARIWTTDREVPVRLLTGHTSADVSCVSWHPNCNYLVTGCNDRTARLWDVQTGKTVRLLTGCYAGVNGAKISPCGRYAAITDYTGTVYYWDLGTGKKLTEFRQERKLRVKPGSSMVHALSFSNCGKALATGGDDCCVRIWDVRLDSLANKPVITEPTKEFKTKQTLLMDLDFTRRNLLLAAGKFVSPVPVSTAADS